ncbi:MAG: glycosyltransferase [Thermoguttaceae bacterium]|nr:glycosyltransferase [Thermoguttaceae bacterium]
MKPKISVIVPVFNVEKYLRECLDSVVNQTLRELEIICVDDGSTDSSGRILDEYAARDERFIVIHQENQGLSGARNTGLKVFQGEFVIFLDSDDTWVPELCEMVLLEAQKNDAELTQFFFEAFSETPVSYELDGREWGIKSDPIEKIAMNKMLPNVWLYLFHGEFLRRNRLIFHEKILFEDIPFTWKARFLANRIAVVPRKLYRYRLGNGISTDLKKERNFLRFPTSWNRMLADLKDAGASPEIVSLLALRKLKEVYFARRVKKSIRRELDRKIAKELLPEELEWIRSPAGLADQNGKLPHETGLPRKTRIFYRSLTGSFGQRAIFGMKFRLMELWDWFAERLYYRSSLFQEHEEERRWLRHVIREHEEIYGKLYGKKEAE